MCSYSRYSAINIVAVLCCNYLLSTLTQAYSPLPYIAWIKTLSLTWFPLGSSFSLSPCTGAHFVAGISVWSHMLLPLGFSCCSLSRLLRMAFSLGTFGRWQTLWEAQGSEQIVGCVLPSGNEEAWRKFEVENLLFLKQEDFPILWKDL